MAWSTIIQQWPASEVVGLGKTPTCTRCQVLLKTSAGSHQLFPLDDTCNGDRGSKAQARMAEALERWLVGRNTEETPGSEPQTLPGELSIAQPQGGDSSNQNEPSYSKLDVEVSVMD
eukprot:TRINITY_DN23641_c0_g1_i4.p1 TRINITY_DN23641_c0_g1~~TRINITY_DN23641_c0_g1_i4.p1  ORF type:complete len:117 (+),score=18.56 TRINITY_DN23641_c0_g1_i4:328-678(+)